MGWEVIDEAMQIMGGEGYMTENELERVWRDHRIHRIVEGANEVMQSFIFAYGGKQLAEQMLAIKQALSWDANQSPIGNLQRIVRNAFNPRLLRRALPLAAELFLGLRPKAPSMRRVHPALRPWADRLARLVQQHAHYFKLLSKWEGEAIVSRQVQQARLADNAMYLFALSAALSDMDRQLRKGASGLAFERDRAAFEHLFDLLEVRIQQQLGLLRRNADKSMHRAAQAALRYVDALPNRDYYIHEASPVAKGTGKPVSKKHIKQFPGDRYVTAGGDGATATPSAARSET
jgi:hypothetical protein